MQQFHFVLLPRFSLVSFSCAVDALRGANQILPTQFYSWSAVSVEGGNVISSSNLQMATDAISDAREPDVIVLCGGDSSHSYNNRKLDNWLHEQANKGRIIGAISDGSFVAAAVGLFDKVPSTIHWKCYDAYRERFPELDTRPSIIESSGKRFSCAGGTASLDLMLHMIVDTHGSEAANKVAQNYFHDTLRDETTEQHISNAFRFAVRNPRLSEALRLMETHLESRLNISQIADRLNISSRQLNRIFQTHLGQTPQDFYRHLRLTRASGLLLQTSMSVSEIAVGCGFQSASHMGQYFFKKYGATPRRYRDKHVFGT